MYLGFAIILVIAYSIKDVAGVMSGPYGQPIGSLCVQVLGENSGLAIFALNVVAHFFVGQAIVIAANRVIFACSLDGAILGSR